VNFNNNFKLVVTWFILIPILLVCAGCSTSKKPADMKSAGRFPNIQPDYSGIVIPSNIAPLNFIVQEEGEEYLVQMHSKHGDQIQIQSNSNSIQIPAGQWKQLLMENIGQEFIVDVAVRTRDKQWVRFDPVVNKIAQEPLDGYLTYRKFKPLFNYWDKMGIFQRNLQDFEEKPVLINRLTKNGCMNCHNFWQSGTDRWLLHLRGGSGTSMLLITDGKVQKIDTKTKFNGAAAYPAWHPSGELIAFSVSSLILFYHQTLECRDVLDRYSDIILYDIKTNTVTTAPDISKPDRMEIWPAWSPDGKFLYFCSAPKLETFENLNRQGELAYDKIKYDLMRIGYNPVDRTWGKLETVVSSKELGLSITEPRVSPDGRFVLFTSAQYSQFPIYLTSADIYLLDIASGKWKKLDVNSNRTDSFHSWSSNSRWFVFSSKRQDGLFTKPYFSHIDSLGNTSKPFVLPQEDPLFYETFLEVYNVPELTKVPISISPQVLSRAAFSTDDALTAKLDPNVILNKKADK
jgi:hypothetical protein